MQFYIAIFSHVACTPMLFLLPSELPAAWINNTDSNSKIGQFHREMIRTTKLPSFNWYITIPPNQITRKQNKRNNAENKMFCQKQFEFKCSDQLRNFFGAHYITIRTLLRTYLYISRSNYLFTEKKTKTKKNARSESAVQAGTALQALHLLHIFFSLKKIPNSMNEQQKEFPVKIPHRNLFNQR